MSRILRLEVISKPVAKARPRLGRGYVYTPTKTQNAEWRIRTAFLERFPSHKPFTGPIEVHVIAWLKMPASIPKKRRAVALPTTRPDCDNYLKTVLDGLQGVAFKDDSQVVTALCSKLYAKDDSPAWSITISDLSPRQEIQPAAISPTPEENHAAIPIRPRIRTPQSAKPAASSGA